MSDVRHMLDSRDLPDRKVQKQIGFSFKGSSEKYGSLAIETADNSQLGMAGDYFAPHCV